MWDADSWEMQKCALNITDSFRPTRVDICSDMVGLGTCWVSGAELQSGTNSYTSQRRSCLTRTSVISSCLSTLSVLSSFTGERGGIRWVSVWFGKEYLKKWCGGFNRMDSLLWKKCHFIKHQTLNEPQSRWHSVTLGDLSESLEH